MRIAFAVGFVLVILGGLAWYQVALWQVCLQDNPWWYCLKVLSP